MHPTIMIRSTFAHLWKKATKQESRIGVCRATRRGVAQRLYPILDQPGTYRGRTDASSSCPTPCLVGVVIVVWDRSSAARDDATLKRSGARGISAGLREGEWMWLWLNLYVQLASALFIQVRSDFGPLASFAVLRHHLTRISSWMEREIPLRHAHLCVPTNPQEDALENG